MTAQQQMTEAMNHCLVAFQRTNDVAWRPPAMAIFVASFHHTQGVQPVGDEKAREKLAEACEHLMGLPDDDDSTLTLLAAMSAALSAYGALVTLT